MEDLNRFFEEEYCQYRLGFGVWNKIYRRSALEGICFDEEEKIGEDLLFNACLYRDCKEISRIDATLYHYVLRQSSAMHTNNAADPSYQIRLYQKICDWYGGGLNERNRCNLFLMHFFAGLNQVNREVFTEADCAKFIQSCFEKYRFSGKTWKQAKKTFFEAEHASWMGKCRTNLSLGLIRLRMYRAAAKLLLLR